MFFVFVHFKFTAPIKNYVRDLSPQYDSPSIVFFFLSKLDELLNNVNSFDVPSFIFLDANIDLSTLNSNNQTKYHKSNQNSRQKPLSY